MLQKKETFEVESSTECDFDTTIYSESHLENQLHST